MNRSFNTNECLNDYGLISIIVSLVFREKPDKLKIRRSKKNMANENDYRQLVLEDKDAEDKKRNYRGYRGIISEEEEFDVPTFLRKKSD